MSYTFLQEQGEESSVECFSDIEQFVRLKLNLTAEKCSCNDNETESCLGSLSGMISEPSTGHRGEESLTLLPEAFLAKTFLQQEMELASRANGQDFGQKWRGWLAKYDRASCSWKTPQCSLLGDLEEFSETFPNWGTMRDGACWEVQALVDVPSVPESFWWPTVTTPTGGGNCGGSGDSKKAKRLGRYIPQRINPNHYEWLMMWPIGWTDLKPLAMDKFRQWQLAHGER